MSSNVCKVVLGVIRKVIIEIESLYNKKYIDMTHYFLANFLARSLFYLETLMIGYNCLKIINFRIYRIVIDLQIFHHFEVMIVSIL